MSTESQRVNSINETARIWEIGMLGGTKEKGNREIQEYGLVGYLFQKKKKILMG